MEFDVGVSSVCGCEPVAWWEKSRFVCFLRWPKPPAAQTLRADRIKWDHAAVIVFYPHRHKDKCPRTCTAWKCTGATYPYKFLKPEISTILEILLSLPFGCTVEVYVAGVQYVVTWVMPEEMKGDFSQSSHRVQSHYRPCQIQLVTEFAAQERGGERQDGEGWGVGMKWISWWENSWGPVLIIKNKERASFR